LDLRPVADPSRPAELRVRAGANPLGAAYTLDPGTRFVTPTVAWTWAEGRRELTHRFHRWTVARVLRDPARPRAVVANNWEATFFDFDEARIVDLIRRAADLGAELFLLDDGWFGRSHPRDDDTQGLGDWEPDPRKLPGGLAPLVRAARDAGIRFGIWGEPEMVNPASSAHATHPDRVLRDRREPLLHRNQLVLDTLRPEVRDAAADSVDRIVSTPGISYLKWDANRPITDPGSAALAPDRQQNLWVDQVHATWSLMDEVVRRHPDLELMLCASGGGRTDHGTLARFHEFWTSDNTDPVTRVRIQWACSHFFPARAMAAHVTRWGGRPLAFGCAVALSGRFGVDLDLGSLTPAEAEVLRASIDLAVRIRPLVQGGELIRLVSPVEGTDRSRAALAYRSGDRREAVLFAYQLEPPATEAPALPLDWLDEGATYHVRPLEPFAATGSVTEVATSGDSLAWPGDEPCSGWIWAISTRPDGSVRSG
jgi:alpha-galactosidase